MISRLSVVCASAVLLCINVQAAESEASAMPASELAARLSAKQEGTSLVRVKMGRAGAEKGALQLQIKSRASRERADIVYQVLFPKERKGEVVLLQRSGDRMSGTLFTPPDSVRQLTAAQLKDPLFGTDLSYEDALDNHFAWDQHAIVGSEVIDRTNCQILESKPGKGHPSSYASVRTWVDPRRFVPLRIEKYDASGKLLRRIATTRILLDGGDSLPANLSVRGPRGTETDIDGSRIKRGVSFSDSEFTAEGVRGATASRDTAE